MPKSVGIVKRKQDDVEVFMVVAVMYALVFVVARNVTSLNTLLAFLLRAVCVHGVRLLLFNLLLNVLLYLVFILNFILYRGSNKSYRS